MKEKLKEIGARIKELRELSELSAKDMAASLKVTVDVYVGYETGELDIPASALFDIAHKLKVDMGLLLTGEETRMHVFTVTRKGEGIIEDTKQYTCETLAEKFIHKKAETMLITVTPQMKNPEFNSHPGQEFDYVLEGKVKVVINENEIILNAGDSIFFDSSYKHAITASDGKAARFLAIVM